VFHYKEGQLFAFGGGNDFHIAEDCNSLNYCRSFLGRKKGTVSYTYSLPPGVAEGSDEAASYLAGSALFKVDEIEAYIVTGL